MAGISFGRETKASIAAAEKKQARLAAERAAFSARAKAKSDAKRAKAAAQAVRAQAKAAKAKLDREGFRTTISGLGKAAGLTLAQENAALKIRNIPKVIQRPRRKSSAAQKAANRRAKIQGAKVRAEVGPLSQAQKNFIKAKDFEARNPTTFVQGKGAVRVTRTVFNANKLRKTAKVIAAGESVQAFNRLFAKETKALGRAKGAAKGASIKAGFTTDSKGFLPPAPGSSIDPGFKGSVVSLTVGGKTVTGTRQEPGGRVTQDISKNIVPNEFAINPPKSLIGPTQFNLKLTEQLGAQQFSQNIKLSLTESLAVGGGSFSKQNPDALSFANIKEGIVDRSLLPLAQFVVAPGKTIKDIHGFVDPENKLGIFFNPSLEERHESTKKFFGLLGAKETKASSAVSEIISGSKIIKTPQGALFIPGIPKTTKFGSVSDAFSLASDIGVGLLPTKKIPLPIKIPALKAVTESGNVSTVVRSLSVGFGSKTKPILTKTQGGITLGGFQKPGVLERSSLREITGPDRGLEISAKGSFGTKVLTSPQAIGILQKAGKALPRDPEIVALTKEAAGLIGVSAKVVPDSVRLKAAVLPNIPLKTLSAGAESAALKTQIIPGLPKIKGTLAETIQLEPKFLARQSKDPLSNIGTLRDKTTGDLDIDFGGKLFGTFFGRRQQKKGIDVLNVAAGEKKFVKSGLNVETKEGETVLNILGKRKEKQVGSIPKDDKLAFGIDIKRSVDIPVGSKGFLGQTKTGEFTTIEENALNRIRAKLSLQSPISEKAKNPLAPVDFLKPGHKIQETEKGFSIFSSPFRLKDEAKLIGQDIPQIAENLIAVGKVKEGTRLKAIGIRLEALEPEIDFGKPIRETTSLIGGSSSASKSVGKIIEQAPDIVSSQAPSLRFFHGTDDPETILTKGAFNKETQRGLFVTKDKTFAKKFGGNLLEVKLSPKAKIVPESVSSSNPLTVFKGQNELLITSKLAIQSITRPTSKPIQSKSISKPLQSKGLLSGGRVSSSFASLGKLRTRPSPKPSLSSSIGPLLGSPGKGPGSSPGKGGPSVGVLTGSPGKAPAGTPLTSRATLGSLGSGKGPGGINRVDNLGPRLPFVNIGAIVKPTRPSPRKRRVDFFGNVFESEIRSFRTVRKDIDFGRNLTSRIAARETVLSKRGSLIGEEITGKIKRRDKRKPARQVRSAKLKALINI